MILALLVWSLSVQAQPSFAGLIVYALDNEASYLLLESRTDAVNVWTGFTATPGWADLEEVRVDAIRRAVSASRCYFSIAGFESIVELTYFRQPWESPAYIVFFARVPKIDRRVLEDDHRDCPEVSGAPNERSRLGWVPWKALRADLEAADGRRTGPVRLVASTRYLPKGNGEAKLSVGFAAALGEMIAESRRKDSTIEFTLPW